MFEAFLILFFLLAFIVIIGAIAGIVDNYLDPHCNCSEIHRQKRESGGVTL